MEDDYEHAENCVFYVVENILGPFEDSVDYNQLSNDFNSQLIEHCACNSCSCIQTCICLQKSGGINYTSHINNGNMKQMFDIKKTSNYPVVECNDSCTCSDNCNNRVVQYGPIRGLKIKTFDEAKGQGLFTTDPIHKGTFICEYAGELITKSQALIRHENNKQNGKMNYIFCLNEYYGERLFQIFVDPSEFGNIGRYINHSCEPNSIVVPVRCQTPIPKLAIFSCVDIPPNTEITIHYSSKINNSLLPCSEGVKCLCNSSICSGFMPYNIY